MHYDSSVRIHLLQIVREECILWTMPTKSQAVGGYLSDLYADLLGGYKLLHVSLL